MSALSLLGAVSRLDILSDGMLVALCGLTGDLCPLPPLVLGEGEGAAPAVEAVLLQERRALAPRGAPAAPVHLPAQPPVPGEALGGQAHECGLPLLQLHTGGGKQRQAGPSISCRPDTAEMEGRLVRGERRGEESIGVKDRKSVV